MQKHKMASAAITGAKESPTTPERNLAEQPVRSAIGGTATAVKVIRMVSYGK